MSHKHQSNSLTEEQLKEWKTNGFSVIPSYFDEAEVQQMLEWAEEIRHWSTEDFPHLNYFESVDGVKTVSRTENFLPSHKPFANLVDEKLSLIFEQVLGEPFVLFKEKINYKYTGTGKYAPHQDVHAFDTSPYAFQPHHVNCAVFLDPANEENGCLEIVKEDFQGQVLKRQATGAIVDQISQKLTWKPVVVPAGTIIIFDMWVPHRSQRNNGPLPRRSLYFTINGQSKGNFRREHLQDRANGKPQTREINTDIFVEKRDAA